MMASARRSVFRGVNRVLATFGLALTRLEQDFASRPTDPLTLDLLFSALAISYDDWVRQQNLFDAEPTQTRAIIEDFYISWLKSPFRGKTGGSRFNNLLWLHLVAHSYKPGIVIDSGTFEGASAWAFATALPPGTVHSYDINLSKLKLRMSSVRYIEADWMSEEVAITNARALCYFDDHVDQVRRLLEAARRGGSLLIFDDDFPVTSFYQMAPSTTVLPKIEFVLDSGLRDGQELAWTYQGKSLRFQIDMDRLDEARAHIDRTARMPFTGLITGIHQTPYRLVVLRRT